MFSVIIPLYNKAPYIEKAINSVLAQTYQEFELIVIDDGSKDDGYEIVQNLFNSGAVSPPLGGFRGASQPNQGVSTARNNGVKLAKYPYIAFLDADDWWAPTYLEEMKVLIEEFPEAGIFGSNYYIVKNELKRIAPIGVDDNFVSGKIDYCQVYNQTQCMPLWTGAVILPKNIFEKESGFRPNLKLGEDFDLWIRIALNHPVALLNKPLAYYNQDVELKNRALKKVYPTENNYLWDNEFQNNYGQNNFELKKLLDNIRVTSVFRYYLSTKNRKSAETILKKIDWTNVNEEYFKRYCKTPYVLLKIKYFIIWDLIARRNRIQKLLRRKR